MAGPRGIPRLGAKLQAPVREDLDAENGPEIANLTVPGAVISQA